MNDLEFLNALRKIPGVGPKTLRRLLQWFETGENAWKSGFSELKNSLSSEKMASRIFSCRNSINPGEEWERLEKEGIKVITIENPQYPLLLKETANPPYLLYIKGELDMNATPCVSIVGARKYTSYGAQIARTFAAGLVRSGLTVVSGMALGIDTLAHQGALEAGGRTIAVLGDSLDEKNIYPRNNLNLSRQIIQEGALLSEYPIETPAGPLTFPARNRLVAGLSLGTLVIEAGEKSGTLITAQMALDANRDVFAVPGSIFSAQSAGTNKLIKNGAKLVSGISDILEELDLESLRPRKETVPKCPSSKEEELILSLLSSEPVHIDNLRRIAKLQTAAVSSTLAVLEIKGWAKNIGGQNYIIV